LDAGMVTEQKSVSESGIQERTTRGEIRQRPRDLSAACTMAFPKRAAARAARSAVTGPCTTGYGPCVDGKRKIVRTQRTATTASSHPMRPEIIDVQLLYRRIRDWRRWSIADAVPWCWQKSKRGRPRGPRVLLPQQGVIPARVFDLYHPFQFGIVLDEHLRGVDFLTVQQVS